MTEFEGEAVLFHVARGAYYGLDDVGTALWHLLGQRATVDDMVRSLLERYDVEEPRLRTDIERLLADLEREQLVTRHESAGAP